MLAIILFRVLPSCLLSKTKIKIYKSIILSVALDGCENWSVTVRKEYRLRVLEKKVLRGKFGPKREEVAGEHCIMRSFITCTLHRILG
jgi:hypothetical protein